MIVSEFLELYPWQAFSYQTTLAFGSLKEEQLRNFVDFEFWGCEYFTKSINKIVYQCWVKLTKMGLISLKHKTKQKFWGLTTY